MKYTKMLCWVSQNSQKEFLEFVKNLEKLNQIILVNNYDDFKNKISIDSYLAISQSTAHQNLNNLRMLLQNFPNHKFRLIFDENQFLCDVIDVFTDADKKCNHFSVKDLIEDYKQKTANIQKLVP